MRKFSNLLKEINKKLNIPQPAKSRVILEIAADLEDTYNICIKSGMSEAESLEKLQEKFTLSDDAIKQLIEIHANPFRLWLDKIIGKNQSLWEKVMLFVVFLFLAGTTIHVVTTTPFFSRASVFIYPLIIILIFTIILWFIKFYQLYIKGEYNINKLRSAMPLFYVFTLFNIFIGLFGYFIEIYLSRAYNLFLGPLFILLIRNVEETLPQIIDVMIKNASLMLVFLVSIMFTAILWLSIMHKISIIEQAEASIMLDE